MPSGINITGQRFDRLTVIEVSGRRSNRPLWKCMCDCGNTIYAIAANLRRGNPKSCGCIRREKEAVARESASQRKLDKRSSRVGINRNTVSDFWSRCEQSGDCLLYRGTILNNGYGQAWHEGGRYSAHRLSYILTYGSIPKGMVVMHTCDNPACVNPKHLSVGTHMDNSLDMVTKGRQCKGERVNTAKLTAENVESFRSRFALGDTSLTALARIFGIGLSQASRIVRYQTWKHL